MKEPLNNIAENATAATSIIGNIRTPNFRYVPRVITTAQIKRLIIRFSKAAIGKVSECLQTFDEILKENEELASNGYGNRERQ